MALLHVHCSPFDPRVRGWTCFQRQSVRISASLVASGLHFRLARCAPAYSFPMPASLVQTNLATTCVLAPAVAIQVAKRPCIMLSVNRARAVAQSVQPAALSFGASHSTMRHIASSCYCVRAASNKILDPSKPFKMLPTTRTCVIVRRGSRSLVHGDPVLGHHPNTLAGSEPNNWRAPLVTRHSPDMPSVSRKQSSTESHALSLS